MIKSDRKAIVTPSVMPLQDNSLSLMTTTVGSPNLVLLKNLAEQKTGSLTFNDIEDPSVSWRVFLDQGKLVFAESCMGHQDRLSYLLKLLVPELTYQPSPETVVSIYSVLCNLWAEHDLPPQKLQKVLAYSTQEALAQIFAMRKSEIVFDPAAYFPPVVKSSSFSALIDPVESWISQWRGIRNEICSPFQRLYIQDWDLFFDLITYARSGPQQLQQLNLGLGKNYTLYCLAASLHMDARELAVLLHPLIKAGAVGVRCYQELDVKPRPLVASLNQRRLDQQLTQRTLERSGFDVLTLQGHNRVIQQLQETHPAVTLLDSSLSDVNAFELCRNIRKVDSLRDLPVIMLMRDQHFMGEIRGQLAGVNDFLKNPITPHDLVQCVNQWQNKRAQA